MTYQAPLDRNPSLEVTSHPAPQDGADGRGLRIELVRSRERFDELAPDWDALAAHHETPLALHGWYSAALDAQSHLPLDLAIPLVWRGERLVGAAPLMHAPHGPRRLVPIDAFTGEPDRILHADPASLPALAVACAELREPVLLRRFSAGEHDAHAFFEALRGRAPGMMRRLYQTSRVALPESFEALEAAMSKSRRYAIRRKQKMIDKAGGGEVEILAPVSGEIEPLLRRFARIENAGWKGRAGTSLVGDETMARFVAQVARTFARTGDTRFCFLTIGGCDAAGRILLRHRTCWCELKIGYDEEFRKCSPGIVLMHGIFREAARHGMRSYSFLGVSEDWQNHWPHERRWDYRLATYPITLRSAGAVREDALRAARSILRRV